MWLKVLHCQGEKVMAIAYGRYPLTVHTVSPAQDEIQEPSPAPEPCVSPPFCENLVHVLFRGLLAFSVCIRITSHMFDIIVLRKVGGAHKSYAAGRIIDALRADQVDSITGR